MNKSIMGVWAISIGVAFYTGFSIGQPEIQVNNNKIRQNPVENTKINANAVTPTSVADTESANRLRISSAKDVRPPVSVVMADLKALLGNSGMMAMDMASYAESYNVVKDLTEEELIEALDLLQADAQNPVNMMPLMFLLGKYAEYDPNNAIAFYEHNITSPQGKMMALSGILSSWSKNDPEGAYEWFERTKDDKDNTSMSGNRSIGMVYIFQGLAKKDLSSAIEKLGKLETVGFEAQMAGSGIANALRDKEEFIEFFEQAKDLDNQKVKDEVVQNWVSRNPEEATAWLEALEDEDEHNKYNQQVLHGWMNTSPSDAAEWYFEKAEDKQKAAERVAQQWAWRNPDAAIEWVQNQEGINSQKSIQKILENSIYQNPEYAIKNLDKISDEKSQKKLSERIYNQLKNQSKSRAEEFLASSPYKEDILNKENKKKK